MTTPVNITIVTDDPSPTLVPGVIVSVYNTGAVFQTSGTTDTNGFVTFSLPDGSYDLLFFKVGASITQPQRITVDHTVTNNWQVVGHVKTAPESMDPTRVTVSGYVLGVDGKLASHRLIFEPVKVLTVISGNVIAPFSRVEVSSDENGYFEFDLLRNTKYNGWFLFPQDLFGEQAKNLDIITPDAPAVALYNLLFPVPITLGFSANTISLAAGSDPDRSITTTMTFTDGSNRSTLSTAWAGIVLTNTAPLVVKADLVEGFLSLQGMSQGTAVITTVREVPSSVSISPLPTYVSQSVTVTVT